MVVVVTLNEHNKVELSKEELEKLLEDAKEEGRAEAYKIMHQPYITITNNKEDWWKNGSITYADNDVKTTLL